MGGEKIAFKHCIVGYQLDSVDFYLKCRSNDLSSFYKLLISLRLNATCLEGPPPKSPCDKNEIAIYEMVCSVKS